MDTHPQEEEEKEKEEEEEKEYQEEKVLTFRDELFNKWFAYKKEKKSKYTPTGIKQLYRTWENKSDQELEEAINNSIANNYQGIFEPKKQFNGNNDKQPLGTSAARMEALRNW
jgi:hypothetical protein